MAPTLDDIYSRQDLAESLIGPLHYGKPELGWAGDHGLVLAFNNGINQRWELLRHEPVRNHPNRHVLVCAAPAGMEINEQGINMLIQRLVASDTQRSGNSHLDQLEEIIKYNDRLEAANEQKAADATADALAKFYTEAGKTFGVAPTYY